MDMQFQSRIVFKYSRPILLFFILTVILSIGNAQEGPHVVFVMGDEEYRSEESMPMLGAILERNLDAKISLCYSLDENGYIDPNRSDHIDGLEALETADLMVMFTRFRALPKSELQYIVKYVNSGKPIVGFRTSTHAFLYKDNPDLEKMNNQWPTEVFGQQWITHHGHFEDGNAPLTSVAPSETSASPILRGVKAFDAYSWLYHVDGGDWKLYGDCSILASGTSLRSNHEAKGQLDQFALTNPVAWTKSYKGKSGVAVRVFFTTLGHPYDFKEKSMRRLALNGIYWALGMEDQIPSNGVRHKVVGEYEPNNSGFGDKYKKGVKVK